MLIQNYAYGQSQKLMNLSHPLSITLCQIIIDCYDMHTFSGPVRSDMPASVDTSVFTFTSLHLCDTSLMQDNTTDQLYPVMASFPEYGMLLHAQLQMPPEEYHLMFLRHASLSLNSFVFPLNSSSDRACICGSNASIRIYDRINSLQLIFTVCSKYFLYKTHVDIYSLSVNLLKFSILALSESQFNQFIKCLQTGNTSFTKRYFRDFFIRKRSAKEIKGTADCKVQISFCSDAQIALNPPCFRSPPHM